MPLIHRVATEVSFEVGLVHSKMRCFIVYDRYVMCCILLDLVGGGYLSPSDLY